MHVVGQTLSGSCHTFRILIDQKPLVEETLGSCTGASGLTYDKTHAFAGRLAEVRTTPLNGTFVWWFTTE